MIATTTYELFRDCKVNDVKTLPEFLNRYYKPDRYKGRGAEYAAAVLATHVENFKVHGVSWISKYGYIAGEVVSFYSDQTTAATVKDGRVEY